MRQPALAEGLGSVVLQLGAAALVQHAVRFVKALPLTPPAGVTSEDFVAAHVSSFALLAALSLHMQQSGGSSGGDGGSGGGGPHPAGVLTLASRAEQTAVAWELIRLVPHLALVLTALEDNGSCIC